jgi:hypothetical protein
MMSEAKFHNTVVSAAAGLISMVAVFIGGQMHKMTEAVTRMDERLANLDLRLGGLVKANDDHEQRLRALERITRP